MSTSLTREIVVDRPLRVVAAYVLDFTTSARWDPRTSSCSRIDEGPVRIGSRYDSVQRVAGRTGTMRYEVTDYAPMRRIELVGRSSKLHTRETIALRQITPDSTRVSYGVTVDLLGPTKMLGALLQPIMGGIADQGVDGIRRILEEDLPPRSG